MQSFVRSGRTHHIMHAAASLKDEPHSHTEVQKIPRPRPSSFPLLLWRPQWRLSINLPSFPHRAPPANPTNKAKRQSELHPSEVFGLVSLGPQPDFLMPWERGHLLLFKKMVLRGPRRWQGGGCVVVGAACSWIWFIKSWVGGAIGSALARGSPQRTHRCGEARLWRAGGGSRENTSALSGRSTKITVDS